MIIITAHRQRVDIELKGNASRHDFTDDIDNLTFSVRAIFSSTATSYPHSRGNVRATRRSTGSINFFGGVTPTVTGQLREDATNTGAIDPTQRLTIDFGAQYSRTHPIDVSGVPAGYNLRVDARTDRQVIYSLSQTDRTKNPSQDVPLTFSFPRRGSRGIKPVTATIDFLPLPATIDITNFREDLTGGDTGKITQKATITFPDQLAGGAALPTTGLITAPNLPSGLTLNYTPKSNTEVEVELTGQCESSLAQIR